MLIRLLQAFDGFELAPDAQPPDSLPPPEWKNAPGRQAKERFFPKTHLTMYSHVSLRLTSLFQIIDELLQKGMWMRLQEAKGE